MVIDMKKNIFIVCLLTIISLFIITGCGNKEKEYYYTATMNDNMINYTVKIVDGDTLNGNLYSYKGDWLSELNNGEAIVNEIDIKDYPDFKIKVNNETYTVKKK